MVDRAKLSSMERALPLGRDAAAVRQRIDGLERLLEGLFELPLIRRKVGLDAVLGLIPGAGDIITGALGLYLVWEARNLGLSRWQLWRMVGNVGLDTALGLVPVAGDLIDVVFRSNSRNLRIVRQHLDRHHPASVVLDA